MDPELSRLASCLPLRCLGVKAQFPLLSTNLGLLKSLGFGLPVLGKLVFFHLLIRPLPLI